MNKDTKNNWNIQAFSTKFVKSKKSLIFFIVWGNRYICIYTNT